MNIQSWLPLYQDLVESTIKNFFDKRYNGAPLGIEKTYEESLRYAVEGGGKRLRPILAMIAYEYYSGKDSSYWVTLSGEKLLLAIIGIELMHCYTLVHDDLPCMDNDDLRRGKPTVWKAYGESMALLVGDTLQTMSFELLSHSGNIRTIIELTHALGDFGVARGQVRDTFLRHDTLTESELLRIHDEKTGVFISASLVIGAILGGGDICNQEKMRELGMLLGRAFQIQDDILDIEGDITSVGKRIKKDMAIGKGIIALLGLKKSKKLLQILQQEMLILVGAIEDKRFSQIVDFVVGRKS